MPEGACEIRCQLTPTVQRVEGHTNAANNWTKSKRAGSNCATAEELLADRSLRLQLSHALSGLTLKACWREHVTAVVGWPDSLIRAVTVGGCRASGSDCLLQL
jgi:hypothetical protein